MKLSKLSDEQVTVLRALVSGATLKSHRYMDGSKLYKLHPLEGSAEPVEEQIMNQLKRQGLIDSNKKFPAATYLLTEKGKQVAKELDHGPIRPLSATNYG